MCRVYSSHEDRRRPNEFVREDLVERTARPWNGALASGIVEEDAGTGRVTLSYLMREGVDLPSFSRAQ
jgi:hypothetical protein